MDTADAYVGDDGKVYRDPCTSQKGASKERWPSEKTACYVVQLVALGMHRARGVREKLYPYHCPKCKGWHLAKCRKTDHFRRHEAAMASAKKKT